MEFVTACVKVPYSAGLHVPAKAGTPSATLRRGMRSPPRLGSLLRSALTKTFKGPASAAALAMEEDEEEDLSDRREKNTLKVAFTMGSSSTVKAFKTGK